MLNHKKRILSLCLTLAMAASVVPMTAAAAPADEDPPGISAPTAALSVDLDFDLDDYDQGTYAGNEFEVYGWATGGTKPSDGYRYTFDYRLADEEEWTLLRDSDTDDTALACLDEAGEYEFRVRAADSTETVAEATYVVPIWPRVVNTTSVSAKQVTVGDSVVITGSCDNVQDFDTVDGYTFSYRLKGDTSWIGLGKPEDTEVTFCPDRKGTYEICSLAQTYYCFDLEKIIEIEVTDAFSVSLDYDAAHPDQAAYTPVGQKIYLSASAVGASGACEYAFYTMQTNLTPEEALKQNEAKWELVQDFSSKSAVAVTMKEKKILWVKAAAKQKDGTIRETRYGYNYADPIIVGDIDCPADAISKSSTRSIAISVPVSGGVRHCYDPASDSVFSAESPSGMVSVGIVVSTMAGDAVRETYLEASDCDYYNGTLIVPLKAAHFRNEQTGEIKSGYYRIKLVFYDWADCASGLIEGFLVSDRNMFLIGLNQITGEGSAIGESVHTSASVYQSDSGTKYSYAFYTMYADCLPEEAIRSGRAEWTLCQSYSNYGNFVTTRERNRILWVKASVRDSDGLTVSSYVGYNYTAEPGMTLQTSSPRLLNKEGASTALTIAASGMSCIYNPQNDTFQKIDTPSGFKDYQITITGNDTDYIKMISPTANDFTYDENDNAVYQLKPSDFGGVTGSYTITVSAADLNTTVTNTISDFVVTNSETPALSVTASAPDITSRDVPIRIRASASGGTEPYTYTYEAARLLSSEGGENSYKTITIAKDTASDSVRYKPLVPGTYELIIEVKDAEGAAARTTLPLTVAPKLVNTSSLESRIVVVKTPVTVKAASTGGVGECQYAVYYKKSTAEKYVKARGYAADPTITFTPTSIAEYDVLVKVKDSMGTVAEKKLTVKVNPTLRNRSAISAEEIVFGNTVTIQGVGYGGTEGYQYAVYYKKSTSDKFSLYRGYRTESSISFKPASAVSYDLKVKVKDSSGKIASKTFTVKVTPAPLVNTSSLSANTVKAGGTVTVNCSCTGGTGGKYYEVTFRKASQDKWYTAQSYKKNAAVEITLSSAVAYEIMVRVKDSTGTVSEKLLTITPTK